MAHAILMPKPGQMTEECTLVAWHKREGDAVKRGDLLFEIETDKSNMDVESFDDGVLLRRVVAEGETVPVNSVCAWVGTDGEAIPETPGDAAGPTPARQPVDAPAAVARVIPEHAPGARPVGAASIPPEGLLRISPRAGKLVSEFGLDPTAIAGSGPEGRIMERDVRNALATAVGRAAPGPIAEEAREPEPRPMSRVRRTIAERLTLSATTVPQFTLTVSVDMTDLVALGNVLKASGTVLTLTDFIAWATAQSLVEFPDVNARTDGVSIWPRSRVHLGIAVSLPSGLVVPVVRDADGRSVADLHARTAELVQLARDGSLSPDDMTGGTFTISNLGMFGVDEFGAIINPGESAILAVSSVVPTPVAIGDAIAVRQVMKVTLTSDHRIVDGGLAARFANAVRRRLEDAAEMRNAVETGQDLR
jgi:pyruvate dehydrogenase E2 component (dihydrolipoamide acetyltransferase)